MGTPLVIMKPLFHDDGSVSLVSSGERFGDPGFYFTVHAGDGVVSARYVPTMRETIRVYESGESETRANHRLTIWRRQSSKPRPRVTTPPSRRAAPASIMPIVAAADFGLRFSSRIRTSARASAG